MSERPDPESPDPQSPDPESPAPPKATPASGGLPVVGSGSGASATDREFLEQETQISSQEFLEALLDDRREDVAKMIVHDERLLRSRDVAGASAVLLACYHGLDEMLGVLLRSEVPLDVFEAAAVGNTQRVRELVDEDPSLLLQVSGDGFPPLQLACFFGRVDAAEALLERARREDRESPDGDSAETGGDALAGLFRKVLEQPAGNPMAVRPVHSAAACRDEEASLHLLRRLLEEGADPDAEQAGGFRPLHQATSAGRREAVEVLLEHGADAGAESDVGKTPADFAAEKGYEDLAVRLRTRSR